MLHVHFGNRIEGLADALAAELAGAPPGAPLAPETIVVGHAGMDEWLKRALANRLGIAANLEFQQPAGFVWRMLRARDPDLPRSSPLDRGPLLWRLYAVLGEPEQSAEVMNYLRAGDELSRYELAEALAAVFEQYQIYRPEWILDWEAGRSDPRTAAWQAALWRRVADRATPNPARLYRDFTAHAAELPAEALPARISVFGVSALAPTYLNLLAAAAMTRAVHLYVPNPSRAYWGDIENGQRLARWRLTDPGRAEYATGGHPLLAALGRQSRDFIDSLQGLDIDNVATTDCFAAAAGNSLLARLQNDILELVEEPQKQRPAADDDSILVHVCHSRRREVEVLHDALLAAFETDPDLGPEDILVMAPNMDDYGAHIAAVFGAAPETRHIPWSLAERSARAEHPVVEALLALLDLPDSRLKASEVLGLLDLPAVARRYELDDERLDAVHGWTEAAGIRWGWNGEHRRQFELPGEPAFTWRFGLDRLLAGYALAPADDTPWEGIAPWSALEGQGARALGPLCTFAAELERWRIRLAEPRPLDEWAAAIRELLNFFAPETPDEQAAVSLLRAAASELETQGELAGFDGAIPRSVARSALVARLSAPRHPRPFLSGRVTFCALAPMRSIPAKFVWLLGMSEADFPRRGRAPGFDLIAAHPRRGDRARQAEDRALFLDALLAARSAFHLSYVGRSEQDNGERPASVTVNLLLDTAEGMGAERGRIVVDHPLQPFSASYRIEPLRRASYASEWLRARRPEAAPGTFASELPAPPGQAENTIALADLIAGLANPARRYLDALGIARPSRDESVADEELFVLKGLPRWKIKDALLTRWLAAGRAFDPDACLSEFSARGWLPPGEVGRLAFRDCAHEAGLAADAVFNCAGEEAAGTRDLRLVLGHWTLSGRVADLHPQTGLVHARAGRLRAKDRLALWIEHLALGAVGAGVSSRYVAVRKGELETLRLGPVAKAAETLQTLCELYARSAHTPLPFLAELSYRLCARDAKGAGTARDKALASIRTAWRKRESGDEHRFVSDADDFAFVFCGRDELFGTDFAELAVKVFDPVVAAQVEP